MISRRDIFKGLSGLGALIALPATTYAQSKSTNELIIDKIKTMLEEVCRSSWFEINDEFTRAVGRSMITPELLKLVRQGKLYDFRIICDETNNTPRVINANGFEMQVSFTFPNELRNYNLYGSVERKGILIRDIRLDS